MFIVYFALWVILNGKWTMEIGVFGVAFAALLYAFTCRFTGFSFRKDIGLARGVLAAVRYGALLLGEILKANVTVMKMILSRSFEPRPQLVHFTSGLQEERHRVALADSITLTPGTITCMLEGDMFVVHCLDASLVEGLDNGEMPAALRRIEAAKAGASAGPEQDEAQEACDRSGGAAGQEDEQAEAEEAKGEERDER